MIVYIVDMATIYKIEFDEYIYIGSTVNMKCRQRQHNHALRQNKTIHHKSALYATARENGINCIEMIELEECSIDDRFIREQHYIDLNKGDKLLNGINAKHYKKEYMKIYRQKNKEIIREQSKKWFEQHPECKKQSDKLYYEKNKERIKEQTKAYREKNKQAELNHI